MKTKLVTLSFALAAVIAPLGQAADSIPVTIDNFPRAESDMYFSNCVKEGSFGKFVHHREIASVDHQIVIRPNRDTLYSFAIFDLAAGPVTITLPDAGRRFRSLMIVNEDHYVPTVAYDAGRHVLTKDKIGTRYVQAVVRTFVDPASADDLKQVHALQDAIKVEQPGGPGKFEVPQWDAASQKKVRDALLVLASTMTAFQKAFGTKESVNPINHLIGTAAGWGGNPDRDATYVSVNPEKNDGKTPYVLAVKDVPVDGFWSVSVYNKEGFFEKNDKNAYSFNNVTAKPNADGSITIHFGGDANASNYLPITPGWNYTVRLYRPRTEILSGKWKFPEAQPVK